MLMRLQLKLSISVYDICASQWCTLSLLKPLDMLYHNPRTMAQTWLKGHGRWSLSVHFFMSKWLIPAEKHNTISHTGGDYWPLYLGFYVHEYWQKHSVHVTGRADTEKSTFTESQSNSLTEWDNIQTKVAGEGRTPRLTARLRQGFYNIGFFHSRNNYNK